MKKIDSVILSFSILFFIIAILLLYIFDKPNTQNFLIRAVAIIFSGVTCSVIAAFFIEISKEKSKQDTIPKLIESYGKIVKSAHEWGLKKIVPRLWDDYYLEIDKSTQLKILAHSAHSLFKPEKSVQKHIYDFLRKGGELNLIIQRKDCLAYKARTDDLNDNIGRQTNSAIDDFYNQINKILKKLSKDKSAKKYKINIKITDSIIYGTLVIFDNRLYHYTPNSNVWVDKDGFSIQANPNSKLSKCFDLLFDETFKRSKQLFEITQKNIRNVIYRNEHAV